MICTECKVGIVKNEWCPRCGVEQPAPPPVAKAKPKEKAKAEPVKKPSVVKRVIDKERKR